MSTMQHEAVVMVGADTLPQDVLASRPPIDVTTLDEPTAHSLESASLNDQVDNAKTPFSLSEQQAWGDRVDEHKLNAAKNVAELMDRNRARLSDLNNPNR